MLTMPQIHRGGSLRQVLLGEYSNAISMLEQALNAVIDTSPNGRDYVLMAGSIEEATREHVARTDKLRDVIAELRAIEKHVAG